MTDTATTLFQSLADSMESGIAVTTLETALVATFGARDVPEPVQFAARGAFADHLRAAGWDDTALRSQYREGTLIRYTTQAPGA